MRVQAFLLLGLWAAVTPFFPARGDAHPTRVSTAADWPASFEGRALSPLPLLPVEYRFAGDFPGAMARFTDGRREILFRRVEEPTRKLHPSAECLGATGHAVNPLPARTDADGHAWSRSEAEKDGETLEVRESICEDGGGACWPDIPSWYWQALLGRTQGPWTAMTVSERVR